MKYLMSIVLVCASLLGEAQTNFVKNGDFERYNDCPYQWDQLVFAKFWRGVIDSNYSEQPEYYNECGNVFFDQVSHVPNNTNFYQWPHSGKGFAAATFYYDKTFPPPPPFVPFDYSEYLQVGLYKNLSVGITYCVAFWVNMAEYSGRAQNKIGAYLDDGSINHAVDSSNKEILSVTPQLYTDSLIKDTLRWMKIEGTFIAKGNETYITIGNFFPIDSVSTEVTNYRFTGTQYSYYLVDDVSVVPVDAKANAGADRWVELGKTVQIGPVEDSTARGMDCKWYHKGKLIDSGNVITVSASSIKYAIDTYIVVQNVCGTITTDTMLLKTVGLGIILPWITGFSIFPNPSNGNFDITSHASLQGTKPSDARLYDLLGRLVFQKELLFNNNQASVHLDVADGVYIFELTDSEGNASRQRIEIHK